MRYGGDFRRGDRWTPDVEGAEGSVFGATNTRDLMEKLCRWSFLGSDTKVLSTSEHQTWVSCGGWVGLAWKFVVWVMMS